MMINGFFKQHSRKKGEESGLVIVCEHLEDEGRRGVGLGGMKRSELWQCIVV